MSLDVASQSVGVRFWAVGSSALLGVFGALAGAGALFVKNAAAGFDAEIPRITALAIDYGVASVAAIWVGYMAVLAVVLGCSSTQRRFEFIAVVFAVGLFVEVVIAMGVVAFFLSGMKSVM